MLPSVAGAASNLPSLRATGGDTSEELDEFLPVTWQIVRLSSTLTKLLNRINRHLQDFLVRQYIPLIRLTDKRPSNVISV